MEENFECDLRDTEESTIKNCSNMELQTIFGKVLGKGAYGTVYEAIVKFGSEEVDLALKKISKTFKKKKDQDRFVDDMYDEVEYSYDMGRNKIGPHVYDAFFYQEGDVINQYIIMEKFDTGVANWILSDDDRFSSELTYKNCQLVGEGMLDILYKQIFILNVYCGDIKTDNFVVNFNPLVVRMIDFGIDWCNDSKLPNAYSKIKSISVHSTAVKKEIFYCMCTLQLFMNILNIGTPLPIAKMILKPFYKDDVFIKYALENELNSTLQFEKSRRIARRSRKRADDQTINFKKIFKDILDYGHDQAILLAHYTKKNKEMKDSDEITKYVFNEIRKIGIILFKK
jgi:hypothetical protein